MDIARPVFTLDDERRLDGEGVEEAEEDEGGDGGVDCGLVGCPGVVEEGEEVRSAGFREGVRV